MITSDFEAELSELINRHSLESASNTPDFLLAKYLNLSRQAFDFVTHQRDVWRSPPPSAPVPMADVVYLGIAARVWCDRDYEEVVMDRYACEEIARILQRADVDGRALQRASH